jgi:hypothetical protein
MAFFQNVFPWEFIGNWVLGDRQASLSFRCPANTGRGDEIVRSYGAAPYNLAGNDADGSSTARLIIWWARDFEMFKNWTQLVITISGLVPAATTVAEVVALLNADTTFATMFVATVGNDNASVVIRQILPVTKFRFYIDNRMAETVLQFNARAGVSELPFYFDRHTIAKRWSFADSNNHLIALSHDIAGNTIAAASVVTSLAHGLANGTTITIDNSNSNAVIDGNQVVTVLTADTFSVPVNVGATAGTYATWATPVSVNVIANATDKSGNPLGYTLAAVQRDYQLLAGRCGLFKFTNVLTNDGTRPLRVVEYPAGATAGYLAKLITYTWIAVAPGVWTATTTEQPYVLTAADMYTVP